MVVYHMRKINKRDVEEILGEDDIQYVDEWLALDTVCYRRKGKLTGMMGAVVHEGILYLAITTIRVNGLYVDMPMSMRKDFASFINGDMNVAIVFSKVSNNVDRIMRVLNRKNGTMSEYNNTHYIWYKEQV